MLLTTMELLTTNEFILSHPSGTHRENEVVSGDVRYVDDGRPKPLMLIAHGYKTHKNWGMFPRVGEYFAEAGFVSIVINFSRNGVRQGESSITDWDNFARFTPTSAIEDIHLVLDAVGDGALDYYGIDVDGTPRVLLGHSGGGGVSILAASERDDVHAVVGWASIATFDRYTHQQKEYWRRKGEFILPEDPEHGAIRIGLDPLIDIEQHADRLNIIEAVSRLTSPILIIHGSADPTVPLREAEKLHAAAGPEKGTLLVIEDADHLFGASHNKASSSRDTIRRVLAETKNWLNSVFRNGMNN